MERRNKPRWALNIPLQIRLTGSGSREARFIDLSTDGARIQTLAMMHAGDRIQLYLSGLSSIGGIIKWASDMFAGIQFDRPLNTAVLDHLFTNSGTIDARSVQDLRNIAHRCTTLAQHRGSYASVVDLNTLARDCRVKAAIADLALHVN